MLVAAHVVSVLLLLGLPVLMGRALWRRWDLTKGVMGLGVMVFIFAELGRLLAAKLVQLGFAEAAVAPGAEWAPLIGALIAGLVTASIEELLRWLATQRYLESPTRRAGMLMGWGVGAGHAGLVGALTLLMATVAIVAQDMTFDDMQALGMENRAAVKIGLQVYAWWEGSPLATLGAAVQGLSQVVFHAGIGAFVAKGVLHGKRSYLFAAIALHALFAGSLAYLAEAAIEASWVEPMVHFLAALGGVSLLWLVLRGPEASVDNETSSEA